VSARTIEVALVGSGYWGANLCRVLAQSPSIRLRWICDSDAGNLQRAARLAPMAQTTAEYDDVLGDGDVSAVVIATPVASHHALAMAAMRAGKHVLVEKPLARTSAEGAEMCAFAEEHGLVLMVGHTFLYNSAVRWIKRAIDSGDLGDIRYAFCRRLNLGIVRHDVDVLWDLGSHDISILAHWFDRPVESVAAVGNSFLQPGIAEVAFAHLTYRGNIAGHVQVSWLDPAKVRQITVVGSRKMLVYDDMSADARIAVLDKGIDVGSIDESLGEFESFSQYQLIVRAGDVWLPRVDFPEPLGVEVEEFARCVAEGATPVSDGRFGLEVVRTLERLSAAMAASTLQLA